MFAEVALRSYSGLNRPTTTAFNVRSHLHQIQSRSCSDTPKRTSRGQNRKQYAPPGGAPKPKPKNTGLIQSMKMNLEEDDLEEQPNPSSESLAPVGEMILQCSLKKSHRLGQPLYYSVEELVELLRKENARDIFLIDVSKKCSWTKYMLMGTTLSERHNRAIRDKILLMVTHLKI